MTNSIACPVSGDRINENAARVAAAFTSLLTAEAVLLGHHWIMAALALDFSIRAFTPGTWSPLRWLAKNTSRWLRIPSLPVDAAPKKFAAGLGMGFSVLIFITGMLDYTIAEYVAAIMLVACAILESVFAYCLGCVIYTFLMRFISNKRSSVPITGSKTG